MARPITAEQINTYYGMLPERVTSVTEFFGLIEAKWKTKFHYYRGEPEEYQVPCLPSVWRGTWEGGDMSSALDAGVWTNREKRVVDEFRDWFKSGQLIDPYVDPANLPQDDSPEWIELAQHYGRPTRLLDVTLDPLVALYFAASKSPDKDGAVYLSTGGSFNTLDPGEHPTSVNEFFSIKEVGGKQPADDTLFLYRPLAKNRRIVAQRGHFIWCRATHISHKATDTCFVITKQGKAQIMETLKHLGYSDDSLLPEAWDSGLTRTE